MKCVKCGHEPCPICLDWCEEVLRLEVEGEIEIVLCCDGKCTYEEGLTRGEV